MADQRFDDNEKYGDGFDPIDDEVWATQQAAPLDVEKTLAKDTVEWQQTRVGAPPTPAPVPSPPQQEAPVPEVGAYDRALDRGSRLSLKLAAALLAVLAVLVVGSIVVSEAAGAVGDAVAGADASGGSDEGASSSGWGIPEVLGDLSDKARGVVSGADGLQGTAKDVASALGDVADKLGGVASGLEDAAGKLGDALR